MSDLKVSGKVKVVFNTQTFESGFSKREFVVTTDEKYPQDVKLEVVKDKCSLLDNFKVGDFVEVNFNLRGNEYKAAYYVNLQAWKINKVTQEVEVKPENANIPSDDLPF